MKKKEYVDLFYLALIGYFISEGIYLHFSDGNVLSVNFYLGIIGWLVCCFYVFVIRTNNFFVLFLLILGVFNLLVFSASIFTFGVVRYIYKQDTIIIPFPGINPLFLLIAFLYFLFNSKLLIAHYHNLKYGSKKDIELNLKNRIEFYYNKFNSYESENLKKVYNIYKDYPDEAQIALKRIHEERKLNYIEF